MDALKQKLFELDVFPNVSTEMSDIESLESRFAELALANSNSFKDFIRHSVGEKALLSENTRRDLVERKSQFDDAENEMKQAFQSIQPLRKEFQTAEEELTRFDKSVETERNLLSQRISRMEKVVEQIDDIDKKLRHIKEEIDSSNVNECHEKNEDCDKKIEQIREECNHLTMVMAECDNRNQVIRNLEDRIRVLNTKELVLKLEKEIEEIQANFSRPSKEIDADVSFYPFLCIFII
jgi:chromosome segregation ATPase